MNFLTLDISTDAQKYLDKIIDWLSAVLPKLIGAILILIIGLCLAKIIKKIIKNAMTKAKLDEGITSFLNSLISVALNIVIVITVLSQLGVNMTTIIAALSAATVAIGLALKDSLSNVASGALILMNKPFKINDYLLIESFEGIVIKIEIMYTTILTSDNKQIAIPNSKLTSNTIINYTAQDKRRVDLLFSISYNQNITEAKNVIRSVIEKNDKVLKEKEPFIVVSKHGESCVEITVRVWAAKENYWDVYFGLMENVKNSFDENNIEIPYNQLDVHLIEKK